jgi:hypothetical protein
MAFDLLDLTVQDRTIGRASIFYATEWDGAADLAMTHLGDTEGEISIDFGSEFSVLTLPELTGPAIHEAYQTGVNPVMSLPLYLADPALRAIVTPVGSGGGGYQRQQPVDTYTIWVVPEQLFIEANAQVTVDYTTAGGWTVGGDAATAAQLALIDQSYWFWKVYFNFPPTTFRHEDAGKAVDTVTVQAMHTDLALAAIPDGNRIFTYGDPADSSIDIHPSV